MWQMRCHRITMTHRKLDEQWSIYTGKGNWGRGNHCNNKVVYSSKWQFNNFINKVVYSCASFIIAFSIYQCVNYIANSLCIFTTLDCKMCLWIYCTFHLQLPCHECRRHERRRVLKGNVKIEILHCHVLS